MVLDDSVLIPPRNFFCFKNFVFLNGIFRKQVKLTDFLSDEEKLIQNAKVSS